MIASRTPLLLLAAGGFVSGMSIRLAEPLLPKVAQEFETDVASASVLITGFTLAYGLFQLVHGPLGDRIGKLRTIAITMCLAAIASAASALAGSLETLALLRFATGMTAGAVIPLSFAYVGDTVGYERRQQVLGRFIAGTLGGAAFGPLIGGVLSDLLGWRASFLPPAAAFAVIGIALIPLARRHEPRPSTRAVGALAAFRQLLYSRAARIICGAVLLEGFLFYGALGYLGAYLRHEFALSYSRIGMVLAGFGVGGLIYSALVPMLLARLGPRRMVRLGGHCMLAGFLVLALTPHWVAAAPMLLLLGFGFYLVHNTLQTRATEMAPNARGAAIAAFAFCLFFGQSVGVAFDGVLVTGLGYRAMLVFSALALAVLASWFARRLHSV